MQAPIRSCLRDLLFSSFTMMGRFLCNVLGPRRCAIFMSLSCILRFSWSFTTLVMSEVAFPLGFIW